MKTKMKIREKNLKHDEDMNKTRQVIFRNASIIQPRMLEETFANSDVVVKNLHHHRCLHTPPPPHGLLHTSPDRLLTAATARLASPSTAPLAPPSCTDCTTLLRKPHRLLHLELSSTSGPAHTDADPPSVTAPSVTAPSPPPLLLIVAPSSGSTDACKSKVAGDAAAGASTTERPGHLGRRMQEHHPRAKPDSTEGCASEAVDLVTHYLPESSQSERKTLHPDLALLAAITKPVLQAGPDLALERRLTNLACSCTCRWILPPSTAGCVHRASAPAVPDVTAIRNQRRSQLSSSWKGKIRTMPRAAQQPTVGVAPLPPESDLDVPFHEKLFVGAGILASHKDHYEGVIVDPASLPSRVDTFKQMLDVSMAAWRSQRRKGVWLKLPTENANLVAPAIEAGFAYHHAEPSYVMLTYWIPDTPSTLPANASHQVGIGAFVMNDKEEVLVVQEKNGILKNTGLWKMPTGVINQAEDICVGAVREVKEETGIDAEFVEIVGFRQGHLVAFEKSDLFFVCILRPLSSQIVKQESEIAAAQWMPVEEFYAQPLVQRRGVLKHMLDVCIASTKGQYKGFSLQASPSSRDQYNFYAGRLELA